MRIKKIIFIFLLLNNFQLSASNKSSFTWEKCVSTALLNNPDILSSREDVIQISAAKGIIKSELFPEVNATASVNRNWKEESQANNPNDENGNDADYTDTYSYGISARQILFDGFKLIYDLKIADTDIEMAKFDYMMISISIRYSLKKAYIALWNIQKKLDALREIESRKKHIVSLVKMRYKGGREHYGSFLTAQADYLESQANVKSAVRDISVLKNELCSLLGLEDELSKLVVEENLQLQDKYLNRPDYTNLVLANPVYLKSLSSKKSAKFKVKSTELELSPKVYLSAGAGKTGDSFDNMSEYYNVGFQITAPLFIGGGRLYNVSKAKSAYRQSQYQLKRVNSDIIDEMKNSWILLQNGIDNIAVKKAVFLAAKERSKIGEAQYSIGAISFDDWIILENKLTSAKMEYLSAYADALLAEAEWIKSKGGTLENEKKN